MKLLAVACLIASSQLVAASPVRRQQDILDLDVSNALQDILKNADNNPAYKYPTDLTRGIIPKPIHSHNDYWRDVPFFSALSVGCESVEADVWLYNDTLFVGHEVLALTPDRTFDSLYIQPILSVLNRQNPKGLVAQSDDKNGVFDTASSQTLYLFVDVKTDGPNTWPRVVQALEPLRAGGYLTTVNGSTMTAGAVTVIGTGEVPLNQIEDVSPRDYFFDADVALLNSTQSNITSLISPIASTDFSRYIGPVRGTIFNETQLATIRDQINTAKARGIGVRYWETPSYPISTRNAVWHTLLTEGVILINADDLASAAGFSGPAPW